METSLHRQLKTFYADSSARFEVPVDQYRIDVVNGDELVEIQHGSLAAIRHKVSKLLQRHSVRVVKPIVVVKRLVKRRRRCGPVHDRRKSPKAGKLLDLFDELIYFTKVFPHVRLILDVPLIEIEEWRYPGSGRRRWRRAGAFVVEDQKLLAVREIHSFRSADDLLKLLPRGLPIPFHTGQLADALNVPRCLAQRIAYCLRHAGGLRQVGKRGNSQLYEAYFSSRAA